MSLSAAQSNEGHRTIRPNIRLTQMSGNLKYLEANVIQ